MGDTVSSSDACAVSWSRSALAAAIERGSRANRPRRGLVCLSLALPVHRAERLLSLSGYADAVFWSPSPEHEYAGIGAARILVGSGAGRFAAIEAAGVALFAQLTSIAVECAAPPELRVVGGFAFAAAGNANGLWRDFGDARFLLPRIAYERQGTLAWLRLTVDCDDLACATRRSRLTDEAHLALCTLGDAAPASTGPPPTSHATSLIHEVSLTGDATASGARLPTRRATEASWHRLVAGIRAEIATGRLEKVVAARRIVVTGQLARSETAVLHALRSEAPHCTRFALRRGASSFLGASPELLLRQAGGNVWSEAIAGTAAGDDLATERALLSSAKDHAEQAVVVRDIESVLAPRCRTLSAAGPQLQRLRGLLHLRTRFAGVLREPAHVLELLACLHPTSAIGGAPRRAALAWLDAHERSDRGFYGGPFGVFGARGDGEFVVAIRSGLLGAGAAHAFAGAGIVAASNAQAEWRETQAKSAPLLAALGVPIEQRPP
jgi:isochorismate synthase